MPGHDGDISRRECWTHRPALPAPSLAFADEQTSADYRAENAPANRESYVVFGMSDHYVPNDFGRGGKDKMPVSEPKIHDRLIEAAWWERTKGVPAQSQHHSYAPDVIGRHGRHGGTQGGRGDVGPGKLPSRRHWGNRVPSDYHACPPRSSVKKCYTNGT